MARQKALDAKVSIAMVKMFPGGAMQTATFADGNGEGAGQQADRCHRGCGESRVGVA